MSKKRIFISIICALIVGLWIIYNPVQKHFAEQEMYKYMKKQGIKKDNIESKRITMGLLNTDYYITVKLKDDPNFQYEYLYQPRGGLFNPKHCYFRLSVYSDKTNGEYSVGNKNIPKYLPLGDDLID
ncbi:DUF3139 domain-containing protein [Tepidibacter sp. Z1-5]|uniref:DUF3139 domain-containing protein n=1 Tax=Tepidibacter sp. Z1-5 TaxID=3134138 RepID=UPI0030BC1F8C